MTNSTPTATLTHVRRWIAKERNQNNVALMGVYDALQMLDCLQKDVQEKARRRAHKSTCKRCAAIDEAASHLYGR
jgi:hypothetical protein